MNTGAAVVAIAVTLFLELCECFYVYHTLWLWWSFPGDANMPVRLVATSSFDHREFFLSRLVIIVVVIQPLTVDIIITTFIFIPLFKRFLDIYHISAAPVSLSKDGQEAVHQFVILNLRKTLIWRSRKWPKHVISKDAVRDISKDGSWSLSWIKELVFLTPFQKLPQSEMSVIASYRNFCSKRLGLLCQCACNSAGHFYIFIVLSNTCYLCDSWW